MKGMCLGYPISTHAAGIWSCGAQTLAHIAAEGVSVYLLVACISRSGAASTPIDRRSSRREPHIGSRKVPTRRAASSPKPCHHSADPCPLRPPSWRPFENAQNHRGDSRPHPPHGAANQRVYGYPGTRRRVLRIIDPRGRFIGDGRGRWGAAISAIPLSFGDDVIGSVGRRGWPASKR